MAFFRFPTEKCFFFAFGWFQSTVNGREMFFEKTFGWFSKFTKKDITCDNDGKYCMHFIHLFLDVSFHISGCFHIHYISNLMPDYKEPLLALSGAQRCR